MTTDKQVEYWVKSAKHDLETAQSLFDARKFDWCLYVSHLVLEKIIKAVYVKNLNKIPPKSHLLDALAKEANIELTEQQIVSLKKINEFNIEARYPDVKFSFYKICTKDFAEEYFKKAKDLYSWFQAKT